MEQAAEGAIAGPVIPANMEICAAGMLGMFHRRLAETLDQGSVGQP